jgi:hypothetical protein
MGLGEYLSGVAEMDYFHQEKAREEWEYENNREGQSHLSMDAMRISLSDLDSRVAVSRQSPCPSLIRPR